MTPRAAQWGRVAGGKGEKSAWRNVFSLSRCVCFWVTTSANTSSLQNEWMKRGRKPQTICAFCPPSYLVNTGEWPSESRLRRVNPLNFFFFFFPPHLLKSLREEEHKSGDGDRRARHLDGKVPHTVLSSCIAPSAGLQRHHWTYETALHMNGERESPAWTLAAADPSPASGTVIPVQALYIILHNT